MKGWTSENFKSNGFHATPNGKARRIITEFKPVTKKDLKKAQKQVDFEHKQLDGKSYIEYTLKSYKLNYVTEYIGIPNRQFRFDYAIPEKKIAIEFNGIFSTKSRHTTVTGFSMDRTKANLAQINGWRILEYTPLNYKEFSEDLKKILNESNR